MTEQAKVPAIRFAGFTDPWEQRKLGELALTLFRRHSQRWQFCLLWRRNSFYPIC